MPSHISRRAAGILLHPTSLPGAHGSGDLGPDAYRFIDWLAGAGQTLWQVLPLGEIGPGNSPYMSRSAFAGNVLLINADELAQRGWLDAADLGATPAENPLRIDFATVIPQRLRRLRRAATRFLHAANAHDREHFLEFCESQHAWLHDYALFMALSESLGSGDWPDWPVALARRERSALERVAGDHADDIHFWKFCQWRFFEQWHGLKAYANERGIRIVGDMPIFVAHQSADVWAHPELFDLDEAGRSTTVAGVPPDYFSETGQLWGNPLYRWPVHADTGFAWWCERLRQASEQADLVRIDHFRGFVAYWEVAAGETTAINGRWVPGPGAALFRAIARSLGDLPIIAEDLGVITDDVRALREQLGLPGMRVLQFAFGGDATHPFLPHMYEANTVAYSGTHDNDTLIGWWQSASPRERAFIQHYLGSDGRSIQWDAMRTLSASAADRVIYPMQDVLGLSGEHRMNRPGLPTGNWGWRFAWEQLEGWHGTTLAHFSAAHGRCALSLAELPA